MWKEGCLVHIFLTQVDVIKIFLKWDLGKGEEYSRKWNCPGESVFWVACVGSDLAISRILIIYIKYV